MQAQRLFIGAEFSSWIGSVVTVDVKSEKSRSITAGVLTATYDRYGIATDLAETVLTVGGRSVRINWDSESASVMISKVADPSKHPFR
ncbi:hypothetical protein [Streptomyces nanshensis]|uniref:Uncharacterized protein n=1 Tax=Streptomyces nanshensis TaxID=518642 RepID=A0A1E7LAL6_9ACTN|nr:hypothetical protein [Streptomyces nanshensis]OEV13239.1 hypothetical protein AN218_04480 [Streptomyces nanshensis]